MRVLHNPKNRLTLHFVVQTRQRVLELGITHHFRGRDTSNLSCAITIGVSNLSTPVEGYPIPFLRANCGHTLRSVLTEQLW